MIAEREHGQVEAGRVQGARVVEAGEVPRPEGGMDHLSRPRGVVRHHHEYWVP